MFFLKLITQFFVMITPFSSDVKLYAKLPFPVGVFFIWSFVLLAVVWWVY